MTQALIGPTCLAVPRCVRVGAAEAAAPLAAMLDTFTPDSAFYIVLHLLFLALRRAPRRQVALWRSVALSAVAISAADVAIGDTAGHA